MLAQLRKASESYIIKILLFMIVLSFVIFGIGDIFSKFKDDDVVKIDGRGVVSREEFYVAKKQEVTRLQSMLGKPLTEEQIEAFGINQFVISKLLEGKLNNLIVKEKNIQVGDQIVLDAITRDEIFSENGEFSAERFKQILAANGLKEKNYVEYIKNSVGDQLFFSPLYINDEAIAPNSLMENLAKFAYEKRKLNIHLIRHEQFEIKNTDNEIKEFYEKHKNNYQTPEYYDFSLLIMDPAKMAEKMIVADQDIKAEYENNINIYTKPAAYDFYNFTYKTESEAKIAVDQVKIFKKLDEFAKAANIINKDSYYMKKANKDDFPREMQDIFALKAGEVSDVIKTDFGYSVIKMLETHPSKIMPQEEVREQLKKEVARKKAELQVFVNQKQIEDEFASDARPIEVASKFDLRFETYKDIAEITEKDKFPVDKAELSSVIATLQEGESSIMVEDKQHNLYYFVYIDKIKKPEYIDLAKVKDKVNNHLTKLKQTEKARSVAFDFFEKTRKKEKTENSKYVLDSTKIFEREDKKDEMLPEGLLDEAFKINKGEITSPSQLANGDYALVTVASIIHDPISEQEMKNFKTDFARGYARDLYNNYLHYMRMSHKVKIAKNVE